MKRWKTILAIHKWITGLGYPEFIWTIYVNFKKDDNRTDSLVADKGDPLYFQYSDATLQVLNSNYNQVF